MFLDVYLGVLAAFLTTSLLNVTIIKYQQFKALKQQAAQYIQQQQTKQHIMFKQPTLQ